MPKSCCVTFCKTNKTKNPELKFTTLPSKLKQPVRRTKWLQAIRRKDDHSGRLWNPSTKHVYVCSLHFITGLKHDDETHPDYIPSLFPNRGTSQSSAASKVKRANRRRNRENGKYMPQCKAVITPIAQQTIAPKKEVPSPEHQTQPEELAHSEAPVAPLQDGARYLEKQLHEEIYNLRRERDEARKERDELARQVELQRFSANCVRGDDTACKTMTGLSWTLFESLHQFLVPFLTTRAQSHFKLPTEDQLFVTLVKLRQNPSNCLMCRVLGLAETTYLSLFSRWLDVMHANLEFLTAWPERECIQNTIPAEVLLQYPRLTSIIDCFEIPIEHPKKLKTRTTVKYLIACQPGAVLIPCEPPGRITYLSKGWGGTESDEHIVRNSGFLSKDYHHAGDQILAGFTCLKDEFAVLGAELITPSVTRGQKENVAHSRLTSSVERMIGVLKKRYHILHGPIPLQMARRQERGDTVIDRIVHVCGALVNINQDRSLKLQCRSAAGHPFNPSLLFAVPPLDVQRPLQVGSAPTSAEPPSDAPSALVCHDYCSATSNASPCVLDLSRKYR